MAKTKASKTPAAKKARPSGQTHKVSADVKKLKLKSPKLGEPFYADAPSPWKNEHSIVHPGGSLSIPTDPEEAALAAEYNDFPDEFLSAAKDGRGIFIHRHGNIDLVAQGGGLLSRGEIAGTIGRSVFKVNVGSEIAADSHIFLGMVGIKKSVANAFVHSYDEDSGIAIIGSMSSHSIDL